MNHLNFGEFCRSHYAAIAAVVFGLAAFNLTFRLDREFVTEWDEALYAMSAWEMAESGDWIGVRMFGNLDYSNTKPPLNVWLLALAFKTFGRSLSSLRLVPALSAWLTVVALVVWSRRLFGPPVALLAGTVLATTFGFLHVHSGRTANTDALFTLLVTLVAITLSAEERRPWRRVWLGPLMAAAFLLRGMGFLMPFAIVVMVDVLRRSGWRQRLMPTGIALLLFLVPTAAWAVARYHLDEWMFFERMFNYDFLARSVTALDGHTGGPFYYVKILLKHQYAWVAACVVAAILCPLPLAKRRAALVFWRSDDGLPVVLAAWASCTLLIPTLMATKTPWYLNTFYPLFALGVARILVYGFSRTSSTPSLHARLVTLSVVTLLALAVAESKLWAYSFHYRDLSRSAQGLLLAEGDRLAGRRVYREELDRSATFVAGLVGAELHTVSSYAEFLLVSRPGDFLLLSSRPHHRRHDLRVVRSGAGHWLLVRREKQRSCSPENPRRSRNYCLRRDQAGPLPM